MANLLTILTCRCDSARLPNKAIREIEGVPIVAWIIKRLKKAPGTVVLATTDRPTDDRLEEIGKNLSIDVFRYDGDPNDVLSRMAATLKRYPKTTHLMRGMGDCPGIDWTIINRSFKVLDRTGKEVFQYFLSPEIIHYNVYGAREFCVSRSAFEKVNDNAKGDEREHVDLWLHRNREAFSIVYHEPPPSYAFREYRTELDTIEDFALWEDIGRHIGLTSELKDIIAYLDRSPQTVQKNILIPEKTGPRVSYDFALKRKWWELMKGQEVWTWNDTTWKPPGSKATPVFCNSYRCLLGWGQDGKLYTKDGHILGGPDWVTCECGSGKFWRTKA